MERLLLCCLAINSMSVWFVGGEARRAMSVMICVYQQSLATLPLLDVQGTGPNPKTLTYTGTPPSPCRWRS